jgi:hypothetical protein
MADIRASDIDIAVQLVILVLLFLGYYRYKVNHKFKDHGIIFTIATVLNTGAIFLLMLPHLNSKLSETVSLDMDLLVLVVHSVIGTIAELLAVYIVMRWYIHGKDTKVCRGKTLMNVTFILWLTSLSIGAGLYFFG